MEPHREPAVALLLDELVRAAVPDLDRAGAVLARRDLALERRVVERMVLDVDGQMALAGGQRQPFGTAQLGERAVALEPEVVVQPPRVMALDDEDRRPAAAAPPPNGSGVRAGSRLPRYASRLTAHDRRQRGTGSGRSTVVHLFVLGGGYQPALNITITDGLFSLLRGHFGPGISLWIVWRDAS